MKSVDAWMSCFLVLMLASFSPAQAPQAQPDRSETKVPPARANLPGKLGQAQPNQSEKKEQTLLDAQPIKVDANDDELRKLLKARYNEAVGEVQFTFQMFQNARIEFVTVIEAEKRLAHAGLELFDTPAEKIALLTQLVQLSEQAERIAKARIDAGRGNDLMLYRARYQRLDAEIQLLRARREAANAKGK